MNEKIEKLAYNLTKYAKDFDPYEFRDCYNTDEECYNSMLRHLSSKSETKALINSISCMTNEMELENRNIDNLCSRGKQIVKDLEEYQKGFDKDFEL